MSGYLKDNPIKDVNSIMREMRSVILEGALDGELDEELGMTTKTRILLTVVIVIARKLCTQAMGICIQISKGIEMVCMNHRLSKNIRIRLLRICKKNHIYVCKRYDYKRHKKLF